jgi:ketosteroid isomerase-like protein
MMNKHFIKTVFMSLLIAAGFSLNTAHAQTKAMQQVQAAVENLRKAMISGDSTQLASLAAEKLSYGHSSGVIQDKKTFVHAIASGESDFVTVEFNNQTIEVTGNTAIVRHILTAATNDKGKGPGNVKLGILLVWVKTHGQWLLLARQAVKVV